MATILSLKLVSEIQGAHLTMDTDINKNINSFLKYGWTLVFEQYQNGLYFLDTNTFVNMTKTKCASKDYFCEYPRLYFLQS